MYKVFIATAKGTSEAREEELAKSVYDLFREAVPDNIEVKTYLAREVFNEVFASECNRDWSEWARYVAAGCDYLDRTPNFNAVAVPTLTIGRSTADICRMALENRRMVVAQNDEGEWKRVSAVVTQDENDWRSGWFLTPQG